MQFGACPSIACRRPVVSRRFVRFARRLLLLLFLQMLKLLLNLLLLNLDLHPESIAISDTLSRAYRLSGDFKLAEKYARKAMPLNSTDDNK